MMSLPFKTGVEEYARQCTIQRRRYEDCRQQARPDEASGEAAQTWTIAQTVAVKKAAQRNNLGHCIEETTQSCMVDLLELSIDPLAWEEPRSVLDETRTTELEAPQGQDDRSSKLHQTVTNSTGKGSCSMSYGAP